MMMIPKETFKVLDDNLKQKLMNNDLPIFRILREDYEEDLVNKQEDPIIPT